MAVLETPWFMKTKTSDLGRVNKVYDERFQANIALLQIKQRKTMMKIEDEIKTIKSEFKHIRSDVDFSKDLDKRGKTIDEETCKAKAAGMESDSKSRCRDHMSHLNGARSVPPELEKERQRYLKLRQRDNRRGMTMLELRGMCYKCMNDEHGDEGSRYIKLAKLVLFPKQKKSKPSKAKYDKEEVESRFSKYSNGGDTSKEPGTSRTLQVPSIEIGFGKDTSESVPTITTDRVSIRPSSAASVVSIKPALGPRYKSMNAVASSDVSNSLGLITSVSI